jgi:uncharacterized protein (TIGR02217 family)
VIGAGARRPVGIGRVGDGVQHGDPALAQPGSTVGDVNVVNRRARELGQAVQLEPDAIHPGLGLLPGVDAAQIDDLHAVQPDPDQPAGIAYGFRFKDWTDYKATGQLLGTGDDAETQFQLVKRYPSGSVIEERTITKPVAGAVRVYEDGTEQLAGWSVDVTTGIVTFATAPAAGAAITADFELDVPVRFDTDHMAVTIESFKLHRWQQIPIVELRR